MLICFCTVWRSYIHSNTWIFSLSDGVADILAICMDAWVLGAVAKGRYSLNWAIFGFNTSSLTLFVSWLLLGSGQLCEQPWGQLCPAENPLILSYILTPLLPSRIALLVCPNNSTCRRNIPCRICLYLHKTRGLMPGTSTCTDVNRLPMPRLSERLGNSPRVGMHPHLHPLRDLGCCICLAFCQLRRGARVDCATPGSTTSLWLFDPCFAPWNQQGNEMKFNILRRILSNPSLGWLLGTCRGWWHQLLWGGGGAAWAVLPTSCCWGPGLFASQEGRNTSLWDTARSRFKKKKKKKSRVGIHVALWKMVLNKHELILATLLWGVKSRGFYSCWPDAQAERWLAVCKHG